MGNGWSRRGFFLARVLLAALLVQLWAPAFAWGDTGCGPDPDGVFAGGNGTAECPYLIETADQLNRVRDNLFAHYRLIADIDLAGYDWEPIGNNSSVFSGTFDGDGHKILDMTIHWSGQQSVGLFGYAGPSAVIRNVGLENANVTGYFNTGGLVGYLRGDIMNSFVEGNVHGYQFVGGLAGYNFGRISDSYAEVAVTASSEGAGGLAGYNVATITDSYAAGTVSSTNDNAGGLVGLNYGTIRNSFATVNVTARDRVGGLAGSSSQSIERSFATGSVSGRDWVGGLVGHLNTLGSITDAYAAGAVTGTNYVGGLVGQSSTSGNITNAYATGEVNGDSDVGGLVGKHESGGIFDSYYNSDPVGQPNNGWGTPKTTDELKRYATFAGWDFKNVWHIHDGQTYPRLRWEEASWDDYSGFAVQLEEAGDKVYGEAFNLTITEATGEFGQVLDGEYQVTVAVVDGDVIYDESVEFAGGNATVTVKLETKGEHQLVVQVDGVAEGQTLAVDVIARLVGIAVTTPPSKTAYFTGETLDLGGLVVTGTWSDGSEETLEMTEEHISGFDSSAPATGQVVTITYEGLTATFTVTIEEDPDNGDGGDTGDDTGGGDPPGPPVLRALHVTVKHEVFGYGGELENQRTFTIGITPDILSIVVDAEADEDVAFVVSTPDGALESVGTAHAEIPVPEDGGMEISLILFKPGADEPTVYTLIIHRMTPDDLVSGIIWNKLKASDDGYEYRYVTNGTTAGTLKSEFEQFLPDVSVRIQTRDGEPVPDHEQVASGARVFLTRDDKYQYLDVILLSDYVREKTGRDESERITLMAIVRYVIGEPVDVNGDGVFDRQDVRLLLGEIV
jgi:hypothetical protein